MTLEHDSRKIEKERDKAKYDEEVERKAYDDRIGLMGNVTDVKCLDLQIFEAENRLEIHFLNLIKF